MARGRIGIVSGKREREIEDVVAEIRRQMLRVQGAPGKRQRVARVLAVERLDEEQGVESSRGEAWQHRRRG